MASSNGGASTSHIYETGEGVVIHSARQNDIPAPGRYDLKTVLEKGAVRMSQLGWRLRSYGLGSVETNH